MNKRIWLGVGLLGIGAAAWYVNNQLKLMDKICFKPVGYKIQQLSLKGTVLNVRLQISNLGNFEIDVKKYKFNIFGDGVFLATAYSDRELHIQPNSISEINVSVAINPKDLVQNLGGVLGGSGGWKNIELTVDGGLNVRKFNLPFYVPVKYSFPLREFTEGETAESPC